MQYRNPENYGVSGVEGVTGTLQASNGGGCSDITQCLKGQYTKAKTQQTCNEKPPKNPTPAPPLPAGRLALSAARRTPAQAGASL